MNRELTLYFCRQIHQAHGIPIRVWENDEIIARWEITEVDPLIDQAIALYSIGRLDRHPGERVFTVTYSSDLILAGMVVNEDYHLFILLGPVRVNMLQDESVKRMLRKMVIMEENTLAAVYRYLKMLPMMNRQRLLEILEIVNIAVNQEKSALFSQSTGKLSSDEKTVESPALRFHDSLWTQEMNMSSYWESQQKLLFLIQHGMYDQLDHILSGATGRVGKERPFAEQNGRNFQNNCLMGLAVICRTAILAGMDVDLAYYLSEQYAERIELAGSSREVHQIRLEMMREYARQVECLRCPENVSPVVRRAVAWVSKHIEEKITADDLAAYLHMNRSYFCTLFKKEMSISIVDYIQQMKIEQAKALLRFTDHSLAEISAQLSFSSQGYFQKIFKDITGLTPSVWREKQRDR